MSKKFSACMVLKLGIYNNYMKLAALRLAPAEGHRSQSNRHHLPRTRIEDI